jgi:apolipoprotein N-acyltransferase
VAAALATGVLFGASFPPLPLAPLAWCAWIPLLLAWETRRSAAWAGADAFVGFLVAGAVAFGWGIRHPVLPTALASVGGLVTWAALWAAPWAVSTVIRRRLGLTAGLGMLVAVHLVVEGTLSRGPWALPWGLLAQTQATVDGLRDLAALSGPSGLSAWVALANAAVFLVIRGDGSHRRAGLALGASLALLALAYPSVGHGPGGRSGPEHVSSDPASPSSTSDARSAFGDRRPSADALRALVVQPAVPALAWNGPSREGPPGTRTRRMLAQTTAALDSLPQRPDLVLWPETALPPLDEPAARSRQDRLRAWARRHDVALLTGAVSRTHGFGRSGRSPGAGSSKGAHHANRAYLFRPDGPALHYDKHHLLPFVEAAPTAPLVGPLAATRSGAVTYRRGPGAAALPVADRRVGPLICSESLVAAHARASVRQGAGLLAVLAQTGWWGRSRAPAQHVAFTQVTAAATGRAALVASVAGPAALVGPGGEARHLTSWMERGTRMVTVPVRSARTPFVRFGDAGFWVAVATTVLIGGAALIRRRRPASRKGAPTKT